MEIDEIIERLKEGNRNLVNDKLDNKLQNSIRSENYQEKRRYCRP
jgi:hypothetical protein